MDEDVGDLASDLERLLRPRSIPFAMKLFEARAPGGRLASCRARRDRRRAGKGIWNGRYA